MTLYCFVRCNWQKNLHREDSATAFNTRRAHTMFQLQVLLRATSFDWPDTSVAAVPFEGLRTADASFLATKLPNSTALHCANPSTSINPTEISHPQQHLRNAS
jgi:hypothetical protein